MPTYTKQVAPTSLAATEPNNNSSSQTFSSSANVANELKQQQQQQQQEEEHNSSNKKTTTTTGTSSGQSSLTSSQSLSSSSSLSNGNGNGGNGDETTIMTKSSSNSQVNSNAEYDHIRNTTLMFFLDRLFIASKDGKEARTLHDLSCLFGTRDFTKEMRQIVGASRNGLRKFLQSYPSLFTIEGDRVYLTQLKQDSSLTTRDYNREAVDYFTQKLLQFGASLVPIRNLFGYRSQASQEVRHVSGKNTREFRQFLAQNEHIFEILNDEHVILKSALKELELRGETGQLKLQQVVSNDEPNTMDPYLNKQFAHLIEDCMCKMQQQQQQLDRVDQHNDDDERSNKHIFGDGRVTLEYLHDKIKQDCNNQVFLKMVETIEDLKVFLRMHPKLFKRFKCNQDQKEYVCLLTEEERLELKMQTYPSLFNQPQPPQRQHSTLKRCDTNESNLSDQQPFSLPPMSMMMMMNTNVKETVSNNNNNDETQDSRSLTSNTSSQNNGQSSLRATAPPFVPSSQQQPKSLQILSQTNKSSNNKQQQQQSISSNSNRPPIQRSASNLNSSTTNRSPHQQQQQQSNISSSHHQREQRTATINPRQAIRSYLLKATTENTNNGLYSPTKHSNGAQYHQQQQPISPLSRQNSTLCNNDDLRTITVNIVREASNVITRIMNTADAVALDCNGYNLGFNGQITMIQLGFLPNSATPKANSSRTGANLLNDYMSNNEAAATTPGLATNENCANLTAAGNNNKSNKIKPEVCVLDLITNPELAYCLKPLLESEQIVKIVHDVRNKSNLLYSQFGIMLNHVFDTQVANLVIQQQETGKPAYKSRYISMSKLCEIYGEEHLMNYRNRIKNRSSTNVGGSNSISGKNKDSNYWQTRPLTKSMIYESTMDVYCLVGGVYQNLKSKIKTEYMPLFEQLNLEGVLARIKPDEIRSVKKERKIDLEVIDLKRKLYSDSTSAIVLSNREIRLLRHIDLTDEVRQKIQQCKKVAKKLERLDMKAAATAANANAQQGTQNLQSMSSQLSMDIDQLSDPNIASLQTNGSNLSSTSLNNVTTAEDSLLHNQRESTQQVNIINDEVTGMSNLMNSSMFDELKDKMIESSSFLESLEDDDDDIGIGCKDTTHNNQTHHHHHHHSSDENCTCNCHRESSDNDKANISLKSTSSLSSCTSQTVCNNNNNKPIEANTTEKEPESKAVDMAIQCDLLS